MSEKSQEETSRSMFDLGHQGDFDWTQIAACLKLTPTERLRRHESWRLFMKEALNRARISKRDYQDSDGSAG